MLRSKPPVPRLALSVQEAADSLGVDRAIVRTAIKNSELPYYQVGAHRRLFSEDLMFWARRRWKQLGTYGRKGNPSSSSTGVAA